MITTVKTTAALLAALKTAKGGDTILLAPGTYSAVAISNIKFKSNVTIASADPAHQAVLSNLSLSNTAYISFQKVTLTTTTGTAATVLGSNHITFYQDTFSGAAAGTGNAMMLRNSDSVTVSGSDFGKFDTGINLLTDSNLSITGNVFHDITSGDIRGTGVTSSTITGNTFLNADGSIASHADVISLWQDNATNHVVIDANIYGSTVAPPPATPAMPSDAAVVGGYVNAAHDTVGQALTGVVGAGLSVTVYDNGSKVGTVTADSSGAWSYKVGALADGSSHSYTVTATDLAGNTSAASAALKFVVDTSAPIQPAAPKDLSVVNGIVDAAHNTASQAIIGTAEAGASVALFDNGTKVGTVTADNTGAWAYQIGSLAVGSSHSYTVTATDLAGNTSAASSALNFTVAAAAAAPPPPSGSTVTEVSNVQQLLNALATAHAGDVIALDAGVYDAVSISNINFSGAVKITSMDSAHHAVFSDLSVGGSSGLTFDHVDMTTGSGTAATVQGSHDVIFSNDAFSSTASGNAMMLRDSAGVTVTGSDFTQLNTGVNVLTDDGLSITNNNFHGVAAGDVRGMGVTNSTISGNTFADGSSSSDVIALWQDNTANNVTITNNVYGTGTTTTTSGSTSTSTSSPSSPSTIITTSPSGAQTVTVSNTAQLMTALQNAHAGDVIKLAAGTYDAASLYGLHFSSAVTITSATSTQAVVNGLSLDSVSGLTFDHLNIAGFSDGYGVYAVNSSNLTFDHLTISNGAGVNSGVGMFVRASDGVTVSNSEFSWSESGIGHLDDTHLTIINNNIHDIAVDGVVGAGSSNVIVSGNTFSSFHMPVGAHPDAIQFFADGTLQSSNLLIADNVITRGNGDPIQGIFLENSNHVEITGNAMSGTMYNGISLSATAEALVTNNFVQGWTDMSSGIITRGGSVDVSMLNDTAQGIANYTADGVNPNYVESGTTLINAAAVGDLSAINNWLSLHTATTASLSDPFFLH